MKKFAFLLALVVFGLSLPVNTKAEEPIKTLRLKTDFQIWEVNFEKLGWKKQDSQYSWNGLTVKLPSDVDSTLEQTTMGYLNDGEYGSLDYEAVRDYLSEIVAPEVHRERQDVGISINEEGDVEFEGFALAGNELDFNQAFTLIKTAIYHNEPEVRLPIKIDPPVVNVDSQELIDKGITQLLSTGETDFSGSSWSRIHNVKLGLSRFDGEMVPPGEESGAYAMIGHVGPETGYREELVIKGAHTVPEYGGGLCQVSTTVYRGLLFAGVPITARRNHSYAVGYYDPQGLDATIYFPETDMKFVNDTSAHILLQTTTIGSKAYANVYGSPTNRDVDLIGPYYYNHRRAPAPKVTFTDTLSPGEEQVVSNVHPGFEASWYRRISYDEVEKEDIVEHIHSNYSARGLITLVGKEEEVEANSNGT